MSVIIDHMSMPTSCLNCRLCYNSEGLAKCVFTNSFVVDHFRASASRPSTCPLIECVMILQPCMTPSQD